MKTGRVVAIHIAHREGDDPFAIESARLVPGLGIEGDRMYERASTRGLDDPGQEVTLIESEALEAIRREAGIELDGAASRRQILTEGVALNHLVERQFRVGEVILEGRELCEPCGFLEKHTGHRGLIQALLHRGGLRARVVGGGTVRPGDPIEEA